MAQNKVVQFRRGTTVQNQSFIGHAGEISIDTDKWTVIVHDGLTAGGFPLRVEATESARPKYLLFRAAAVQQGVASLGFSSPFNLGPQAIAYTESSGLIVGVASFIPDVSRSVQDHFLLPLNWSAPMEVDVVWRTSVGIGTVCWSLENFCVADGIALQSNSFSSPDMRTQLVGQINTISTLTIPINTSSFPSSGEFFFRLTRDINSGLDTVQAPVELVSLRFTIRILES